MRGKLRGGFAGCRRSAGSGWNWEPLVAQDIMHAGSRKHTNGTRQRHQKADDPTHQSKLGRELLPLQMQPAICPFRDVGMSSCQKASGQREGKDWRALHLEASRSERVSAILHRL
jgi:hypothetical protein